MVCGHNAEIRIMPLRCPLFLNDGIADGPLSVRRCDQAIAIMVVDVG